MEILLAIFFVCILLALLLSGPLAFIWCSTLSSRLNDLEVEKNKLERQIKELQHELLRQAERSASGAKRSESVSDAIQTARERSSQQFETRTEPVKAPSEASTITDPAERTAAQWAQSVAHYRPAPKTTPPPATPADPAKPVSPAPPEKSPVEETKPQTPPVPDKPSTPPTPLTTPPSPKPSVPSRPTSVAASVAVSTPIKPEKTSDSVVVPVAAPMVLDLSTPLPGESSGKPPRPPRDDEEWERAHPLPESKDGSFSWQSWELWIGRKLLGWVAVIGFVLSATFFIRYAVQEGWVGPGLKVLGIATAGIAFLGVGKYFSVIGWRRFSTMLSSAGIIVIFQAGYASYAFYDLISISAASVVMTLIVVGSFLLAWHYRSNLLGIIAIIGGLAVPLLLSTGSDQYPQFFTYLIILNVGTVMLVNLLNRAPLGVLAFFGTQAEFCLWYREYYVHPDKLWPVLIFQGLFYAVYLIDTTLASMIPWKKFEKRPHWLDRLPSWDDSIRAILSPIILFGTIWFLLRKDPVFDDWIGIVAFIGAAWYALLSIVYGRHIRRIWDPDSDRRLSAYWKAGPTAAIVMCFAFIAVGIPLQFSAQWIALGWVAVFAGLWYFGHRQENKAFLVLSSIFAGLGFIRLVGDIFAKRTVLEGEFLTPLFNLFALPSFAASLIVIAVAVLTDRWFRTRNDENADDRRTLNFCLGLLGFGFLTAILSVESTQFFMLRPEMYIPAREWASLSLTVLWCSLALLLFETGALCRSVLLRNVALFGFVVVAGKMVVLDFVSRAQFSNPLTNPFCPGLIFASLVFIVVGIQGQIAKEYSVEERRSLGILGIAGIFTLLGILSVECFQYFARNPFPALLEGIDASVLSLLPWNSLSVLWTLYATVLVVLGLAIRSHTVGSLAIRACGWFILSGCFVKIAILELLRRPDYQLALLNPGFLTAFGPVVAVLALTVWTTGIRPVENTEERNYCKFLFVVAILFLWILLSIECFAHFNHHPAALVQPLNGITRHLGALASLSILWTVYAAALVGLGLAFRFPPLRACGLFIFAATFAKITAFELFYRPDYESAFFNPYFLATLAPVLAALLSAVWTLRLRPLENRQERDLFLALGLVGLLFLWIILSVECFTWFDKNPFAVDPTDDPTRRFVATASLSVLWAFFGGSLVSIGVSLRSFTVRACGMIVLVATLLKIAVFELARRPDFATSFFNPYFLTILCPILVVILCALWTVRLRPLENQAENDGFLTLGLIGVLYLWIVLSVEMFAHFMAYPLSIVPITDTAKHFVASASLSVLWAFFALALIGLGISFRSAILRLFGQCVFAVTVGKILFLEMFDRPAFEIPLLNPYFLSIFIPVVVMIAVAIWTTRYRPLENPREKQGFLAFGLLAIGLLWGSVSIECFQYFDIRTTWPDHRFLASASLTVLWTVMSVMLAVIAASTSSKALRILAVGLLLLSIFKALPLDLMVRPAYTTPFFNPYAAPLTLLAVSLIFVCVGLMKKLGETDRLERSVYRFLAFVGVVFLWTVLSLECFKAVRVLQDAESEAWRAQMALSILWSAFALALICVGFVWRSEILRWMAILLFAATLTKILVVDMAGVHELYRFGAIFALATVLTLAAWAYQRFKPEKTLPPPENREA